MMRRAQDAQDLPIELHGRPQQPEGRLNPKS